MEEKKMGATEENESTLSEELLDEVSGGTLKGIGPRICAKCGQPYKFVFGKSTLLFCENCRPLDKKNA